LVGCDRDKILLPQISGPNFSRSNSIDRLESANATANQTACDRKKISLSHTSADPVRIRVEVDLNGNGQWVTYRSFEVAAGQTITHLFPAAYQAYWLRTLADTATTATAQLTYD
jgi:hypothetical protein